jgi:XTP/dITP diphosphohydrolase
MPRMQDLPPCVEDGSTFEENARKKALHYSAYVSGPVFADDSGICVDALDGAPGIHSARYASLQSWGLPSARVGIINNTVPARCSTSAGSDRATDSVCARDDTNNMMLLRELEGVPDERRTAHYACVIALAQIGRVLKVTEGRVDGVIIKAQRGNGGFGYDPYFLYPPLGRTFAELSPDEKFSVSHRGQAFRRLLEGLDEIVERAGKENRKF